MHFSNSFLPCLLLVPPVDHGYFVLDVTLQGNSNGSSSIRRQNCIDKQHSGDTASIASHGGTTAGEGDRTSCGKYYTNKSMFSLFCLWSQWISDVYVWLNILLNFVQLYNYCIIIIIDDMSGTDVTSRIYHVLEPLCSDSEQHCTVCNRIIQDEPGERCIQFEYTMAV